VAYPETGNLIEHNLIWVGKSSWNGATDAPVNYPAILWNDATGTGVDLGHNTIRDNIIVTYNGETFRFAQAAYADTTTITNNKIYRVNGSDFIMSYGNTNTYSLFGMQQTFSVTINNNAWLKALPFNDVSIDYYNAPEKFDFTIPQP
jgi:hypothetical protein